MDIPTHCTQCGEENNNGLDMCDKCVDKYVETHWACGCPLEAHKDFEEYLQCEHCDE